jgi:hypothetical protein
MQAHDRVLQRIEVALPIHAPVLEDPDLVREPLDVGHDVRREHDRAIAVRGDLDDLLEELSACDGIEARDGLVEDQHIGLVPEPEQDRQLLPLPDGHVLDALIEIDFPLAAQAADELVVPFRIERCNHADLIGCRQLVHELVLLRHEADACLGRPGEAVAVVTE